MDRRAEKHLPALVCAPLDRLLFVHTSAIEVPVEGSISILPQWLNSQAIWIQPLFVMWVDIRRSKLVQDCVLKSSILSHKVMLLSSDSKKKNCIHKQVQDVRRNKSQNYHRYFLSTSNSKTKFVILLHRKQKTPANICKFQWSLNVLHDIMI